MSEVWVEWLCFTADGQPRWTKCMNRRLALATARQGSIGWGRFLFRVYYTCICITSSNLESDDEFFFTSRVTHRNSCCIEDNRLDQVDSQGSRFLNPPRFHTQCVAVSSGLQGKFLAMKGSVLVYDFLDYFHIDYFNLWNPYALLNEPVPSFLLLFNVFWDVFYVLDQKDLKRKDLNTMRSPHVKEIRSPANPLKLLIKLQPVCQQKTMVWAA